MALDVTNAAKVLVSQYMDGIQQMKSKSPMYWRVRDGTGTAHDVYELASQAGKQMGQLTVGMFQQLAPNGQITEDIARSILPEALQANHDVVTQFTAQLQRTMNEKLGIGIKPLAPDLKPERVEGLIKEVARSEAFDNVKNKLASQIETLSMSHVDDAMRENAKVMRDLGFETTVIRKYHEEERTTPSHGAKGDSHACVWCAARETPAEGVSVKEAYDMGVFERHDGCHCTIEYITKKDVYRSRGNGTAWDFERM